MLYDPDLALQIRADSLAPALTCPPTANVACDELKVVVEMGTNAVESGVCQLRSTIGGGEGDDVVVVFVTLLLAFATRSAAALVFLGQATHTQNAFPRHSVPQNRIIFCFHRHENAFDLVQGEMT